MAKHGRWLVALVAFVALGSQIAACEQFEEPLPRRDRLHFPIGLALHPSGDYLYAVNSNFDGRYTADRGSTLSVIDTHTLALYPEGGAFLPSYGGYAKLNADASKLYITARQGDSLVALDVTEDGSAVYCGRDTGAGGALSSDGLACTVRAIKEDGNARIPSDPFGLAVATIQRTVGDQTIPVDVVGLAHLNSTNLTAVAFPGQDINAVSLRSSPLIESSNQIALRPGTLDMVATGRLSSRLIIFTPYINAEGDVEAIIRRGSVELTRVPNQTVDARGIAFSADGAWMYVTSRFPDVLHVFRVGPANLETGAGTEYDLSRVINLGQNPSDVVVHRPKDSSEDLLYIPCAQGQRVQVVDPKRGVVVADIPLDASPYSMVTEANLATRCRYPGDTCRGFVTLFNDSPDASKNCDKTSVGCGSVAVIDLDPASPRYHQVIAKIH
jgi:DNA-binding beta-propeller fold protein YncE